jgi:aminopeptidase N
MIVEETIPAMWEDGYESSHPLQINVEHLGQLTSIFDVITSSKGAAIMRMVESIVGNTQFLNGLKVNYFLIFPLSLSYIQIDIFFIELS